MTDRMQRYYDLGEEAVTRPRGAALPEYYAGLLIIRGRVDLALREAEQDGVDLDLLAGTYVARSRGRGGLNGRGVE